MYTFKKSIDDLMQAPVTPETAVQAEKAIQVLTVDVFSGVLTLETAQEYANALRARYAAEFFKLTKGLH